MGADDLVCAVCSGRVGDARCPTCRAALRRMREDDDLPAGWFLLAAAVVLLLIVLLG